MKYAYSLMLRDDVSADEVGYEDCEQFVIRCIGCGEAVFKAQRGETHYFSHHKKKPDSECEMRVIAHMARVHSKRVVPHGQELEKLLKRFSDVCLDIAGYVPESWHQFVDPVMKRPLYRNLIYTMRTERMFEGMLLTGVDSKGKKQSEPMITALRVTGSPLGAEVTEAVVKVIEFLIAPNSFSALLFAITFGMSEIVTRWGDDPLRGLDDNEIANVAASLLNGTDREFRAKIAYWRDHPHPSTPSLTMAWGIMHSAVTFTMGLSGLESLDWAPAEK
jgi:hypothetical protein